MLMNICNYLSTPFINELILNEKNDESLCINSHLCYVWGTGIAHSTTVKVWINLTLRRNKTLGCYQGDSIIDEWIWGRSTFYSRHLPCNMHTSPWMVGFVTKDKRRKTPLVSPLFATIEMIYPWYNLNFLAHVPLKGNVLKVNTDSKWLKWKVVSCGNLMY